MRISASTGFSNTEVIGASARALCGGVSEDEAQVKWVEDSVGGERMETECGDSSLGKLGCEGRWRELRTGGRRGVQGRLFVRCCSYDVWMSRGSSEEAARVCRARKGHQWCSSLKQHNEMWR